MSRVPDKAGTVPGGRPSRTGADLLAGPWERLDKECTMFKHRGTRTMWGLCQRSLLAPGTPCMLCGQPVERDSQQQALRPLQQLRGVQLGMRVHKMCAMERSK